MKKSVIILIGIVYVLSIFIVSFLGLKIDAFDQVVYVDRIEIINEVDGDSCKVNSENRVCVKEDHTTGEKYFVVKYDPFAEATVVSIDWRVYPDNATNKDVVLVYDEENPNYTIKGNTVAFTNKCTMQLSVHSTDGISKKATITIYVI